MIRVLQEIFEKSIARLSQHLINYIPPLLVAGVILLAAFLVAVLLRWLILKATKGVAIDRFLRESGLASVVDRSGRLRASCLLAGIAYWTTLGIGLLTAIDVFDTTLTSRIVEETVIAVPKMVTAGAILLAGFWLSRYLGRSILVWAVNEGVPHARRAAAAAKIALLFVAVVVAAETLGFAERVFYTAFVIAAGGAVLSVSIAGGLALRAAMDRSLKGKYEAIEQEERSLWNHL